MNSNPLISVIIPVFNREQYIQACLEMVLNQSYKNLQVIVVNDGSSDGSMDIIKKYPVTVIEHDKNRGLAAARNTGIDNATGKYIHFMDDDDKINTDFYKNLVNSSEVTNADISASGMISEASKYKKQIFSKQKQFVNLQDKLKATYVGKWGYVWRYLFKLDFLKKNHLYFEEGQTIEDLPFSFRAVYFANKLVTVPNTQYLYVFNADSIMNSKTSEAKEKRRLGRVYAKKFILNFAKENGDFKIYGVNKGKLQYLSRKVLLTIFSK